MGLLSASAARSAAPTSCTRARAATIPACAATIRALAGALACSLVLTTAAAGQTPAPAPEDAATVRTPASAPADGPPAPSGAKTMARDAAGKTTVRAVRLQAPLRIDGRLDEDLYSSIEPISDFIMNEPRAGEPATEKTDIWIAFDRTNVYVSFRCWETHPERLIANEMRRDNRAIIQGDDVAFMFDTFLDRRNSVLFNINPIGGRMDGQVTNEQQNNGDWNPIWNFQVGRFEQGWTVEAAIPFKSLRYRSGQAQVWGFNARRNNTWKNEISYLTRVPAGRGTGGILLASVGATMVGLEAPAMGRTLEVKPYITTNVTTDRAAQPAIANDPGGDIGVDAKYGVTQNLTADLTINTDFAQVEADEQQVNLTRFSLFFPEKREFFLENQGVFSFGGVSVTGTSVGSTTVNDAPILFYSRRVGLEDGQPTPITAGGRLTGRAGAFSLGALNIQTGDTGKPGSTGKNYSVFRLKRDFLRRSGAGLIFTGRSPQAPGDAVPLTIGADSTFAFFDNLAINSYWARTEGPQGHDVSYRTHLAYTGDRYGVQLERLVVGDRFDPVVGFVRRDDMRRSYGELRFSPRPRNIKAIRKVGWTSSLSYVEDSLRRLSTRDWISAFFVEFRSSDRLIVDHVRSYEFLPRPFRIVPAVAVTPGGYDFANSRVEYDFGRQRRISGNVIVERGTFYSGHKTAVSVAQGRVNPLPQLSFEPTYSINAVDLAEGSFTTHLLGTRFTYTMTPWMFTSALVQYNSSTHAVSANVRLRWEYQPGSEFFLVFNEQRDTAARHFPELTNRAVVLKFNRLFRY